MQCQINSAGIVRQPTVLAMWKSFNHFPLLPENKTELGAMSGKLTELADNISLMN